MRDLKTYRAVSAPCRRSSRRIAPLGLALLAGVGLAFTAFGIGSACNYGVFAPPTNAGATVCKCTCGNEFDPDSGDSCTSTCRAPFNSDERLAHRAGCDSEFSGYSQCLIDHGTCTNQSFDAPGCGSLHTLLTNCEANGLGAGGSAP